jgi:hypothetical protein
VVLASVAGFGDVPPAAAQAPGEYQIKAGFLYNFAKFVTWPAASRPAPDLRLCLAGTDPAGEVIKVIAGKRVGEGTIAVERIAKPAMISKCHMLFVSAYATDADHWLGLGLPGVLTVSEEGVVGTNTGMIHLRFVDNRIRFEIDRGAAGRAGLEVSSQLLSLALKVRQ